LYGDHNEKMLDGQYNSYIRTLVRSISGLCDRINGRRLSVRLWESNMESSK